MQSKHSSHSAPKGTPGNAPRFKPSNLVVLGSLLAFLVLHGFPASVHGLPPREPGDGTPIGPCPKQNSAIVVVGLQPRGLPLVGCDVDITAGGSKIEITKDLCHDPVYADLPSSFPLVWQLVSWPGSPAPNFTSSSTLATLSLPRAGSYVVRFTVCPSGKCSFRPTGSTSNLPIAAASGILTIVAVDSIPIQPEKIPVLPPLVRASTAMPVNIADLDCRCAGNGDPWGQQWVTVAPWTGANDYKTMEGVVNRAWVAITDDILNHTSNDVGFEVTPDPPFRSLINSNKSHMDVEWETGSYPERFRPSYGDRISAFGFWILDCGHKPNAEIHPPVGVAVHRPRPILIPSNQSFTFNFSDGAQVSTVGNNVFVPGVLTDLWFNRHPGEITSNCSDTALHQPASCNPAYPGCAGGNPPCSKFLLADCIEGDIPLNRIYEFNIYLPRNPAVIAREQGVTAPTPPIYVKVSNPWNFGGPNPTVAQRTDGDVTYLHVTLDLRAFAGNTYSRRIEAAWVYPASDNWSLQRWRVSFPTLDVHDDQDPWTDGWNADGDYRFWFTVNNRDQEWTRILYGDDNAHGKMNFSPVWRTGSTDPVAWREFPDTDSAHRLGPDVLSYPEQGVLVTTTAYESDSIWDDDPGRTSARFLNAGTRTFTSDKGNYSVHVEVQPGPPVGGASLSRAAGRLNSLLRVRCHSGPFFPPIGGIREHPLELVELLVPGIADEAPWTTESDKPLAELGTSVAGVGDVNGDGFPVVLLGAPFYGKQALQGGRVQLHYGFPTGMATAPSWVANDQSPLSLFGVALAPAGDVNKDGFADFIVGAPNSTRGQTNEGAAYVWYGAPTSKGPTRAANWQAEGNFPGAGFGTAVASGDVNQDGFSDVIVGAPYYQNSVSVLVPLGRVFVFLGSSKGLSATPSFTLTAPTVGGPRLGNEEWFGYSLAVADVNGDRFPDVIVGAPHFNNGGSREGAIFVYMSSAAGLSTTPRTRIEGGAAGAEFGSSVAAAGDVNGDGIADVIVGAPFFWFDDVSVNEGAASLFLGSGEGLRTVASWGRTGRWGGARFGHSVAGVGDLNGDGLSDVVVGSPFYSTENREEGRISVFLGHRGSGELGEAIWVKSSQMAGARFGFSLSGAGDMDRDGFADFIVGAPGQTHSEKTEGAVSLFRGLGPREIRPATSKFFESVDEEPNRLFNLRNADFGQILLDGQKNEPVMFERMLTELREELQADFLGTPREPDAIAGLAALKAYLPETTWNRHFASISPVTAGGLYLDCGATEETVDALGRRWKPDQPFLLTTGSNRNPFSGQTINTTLLTDRSIPNNVLLSERWKNGDLRYEIPVENGLHTVILYFSENCPSCVNSNLGGTVTCATCARLFDIEVEGRRVNAYNPADAGLPPAGDGKGTTFKATQVVFRDIAVTDGLLNVNIIDRGNTNPPENSAIDAMVILQTPVQTPQFPPRVVGIRKVELNFAIRVNPGLNLASHFSGLSPVGLERSPDLKNWVSVPVAAFLANGELNFEVKASGTVQFYRATVR